MTPEQLHKYDSIRPFEPEELPEVFDRLVQNEQFCQVLAYLYPGVPVEAIRQKMHQCKTNLEFQKAFCYEFLKNLLANKSDDNKAVKEFVNTPISVFFNINKTNIASQKDLVNIEALAKYAKENGAKLKVDGYADSATGNASINQRLSEGRANTVADELVKMGVDRSKITTQGHGGVDELSPVLFNCCVTVKVAD